MVLFLRIEQRLLKKSVTSKNSLIKFQIAELKKADSTLRSSQAVPHPSTIRALRRLTSEFGRDPVYSSRYGR